MNERLTQLLDWHKNDPEDAFILFAIAKEYDTLGSFEKANSYFEKLKSKDPNYVGLYYHLGKNYESLDQPKKAIKTYEEGIVVCQKQKDLHAESELRGALTNLRLEL